MLKFQQFTKHQLNEDLRYSGKDVTKMPVIGKLTCTSMTWRDSHGNDTVYPPETYDIVETIEDGGVTYYVTSKWYKEGRVPLIIHPDLVDQYIPYAQ
jgi:hypothetical protein